MTRETSASPVRVQEQAHPSSQTRGGVVVRVGNQQWIVGSNRPSNEMASTDQVTPNSEGVTAVSKSSKWIQMFQAGASFGLLLGCISMMLVHQFHHRMPVALSNAPHTVAVGSPRKPVVPVGKVDKPIPLASGKSVMISPPIQIPAVRLYALTSAEVSAPLAEQWSAQATRAQVPNITIPSGAKSHLLLGIAGYSAHLNIIKNRLHGLNASMQITPYRWNARLVQATGKLSSQEAQEVSSWLSAEVSAMNALTAVIVDAAHNSDAAVAYAAANKLLPSSSTLERANHVLPTVSRLVFQAFSSHRNQLEQSALRDLMQAYEALQQISQGT